MFVLDRYIIKKIKDGSKTHSTQSPNDVIFLVRASMYCYMDHGEEYSNWKENRYKSIFDPVFVTLTADPKIIYCPKDSNLFFMTLETDKEIMLVFPGTRKSLQGNNLST